VGDIAYRCWTRSWAAVKPIFKTFVRSRFPFPLSFASLGVTAALVARAFKNVVAVVERWCDAHPVPQSLCATLGGFLVGAIAMRLPAASEMDTNR
jgi:H+/Cl- antiporter ClcA